MRTVCAAVIASVSATWVISARQPQFKAGTELVTIDVVATAADGRPVRDLKASDFALLEDGVPRAIAAFQFVDLELPDAEAPNGVVTNTTEQGAACS